jgi:predicted acylesterase/phospholipase RssA
MTDKFKLRVIASGGGARGIFQLGVMKKIMDSGLFEIDAVYGCSIGAVLAPSIANGRVGVDKALTFFDTVKKTDDIIERNSILGFKLPEWNILLTLYSLFTLSAFKRSTIVDKILGTLTEDEINVAKKKCHVIAYDYTNDLETWFTSDELSVGMECSSALWLVFPPIQYKGNLYVDGGVSQYTPTDYILDHNHDTDYHGYYIIIETTARPRKGEGKESRQRPSNGIEFLLQLREAASKMLNKQDVERLKKKLEGRLFHVVPDNNYLDTLDFDQTKRALTLQEGFAKGEEFLNIFKETVYTTK